MRSYSAQFDLMKDVRVRVYTLLSGPCTGGKMVMSTNYTEVVRNPPSTGNVPEASRGNSEAKKIQSIISKMQECIGAFLSLQIEALQTRRSETWSA